MTNRLEQLCLERGLRLSEQRRIIIRILNETRDHPSAEEVHRRVTAIDPRISMATVYRTLNIFAEAGFLTRLEFGDGKAHYEDARSGHHEHLIDVQTGKVLEFRNDGIEALLKEAADRLGYRLVDYRLEVFGEEDRPATVSDHGMSDVPTAEPASHFSIRRARGL